jgi:hypothetical protein
MISKHNNTRNSRYRDLPIGRISLTGSIEREAASVQDPLQDVAYHPYHMTVFHRLPFNCSTFYPKYSSSFFSSYMCISGLSPIFSFEWNPSLILCCIPKQLDSVDNDKQLLQPRSPTSGAVMRKFAVRANANSD